MRYETTEATRPLAHFDQSTAPAGLTGTRRNASMSTVDDYAGVGIVVSRSSPACSTRFLTGLGRIDDHAGHRGRIRSTRRAGLGGVRPVPGIGQVPRDLAGNVIADATRQPAPECPASGGDPHPRAGNCRTGAA